MTNQIPETELAKIVKEMNGVVLKQVCNSAHVDQTILKEVTIQAILLNKIANEVGISDDRFRELGRESESSVQKHLAERALKKSEGAE